MKATLATLTVLLTALVLAGCARQIEGIYVGPDGEPGFRLVNGKYYGTSVDAGEARPSRGAHGAAMPIPMPYKVDGTRLIVATLHGEKVMQILPDGALQATAQPVRYVRRGAD